jgi:hypothetical protein
MELATITAEREKWLRLGRLTTLCNRPASEAAVRSIYTAAGLPEPRILVWMDSPLGNCLAGWAFSQLRDQIRGQLRDQLSDQLSDQLRGELRGQLWGELRDQLSDQLRDQLSDQLSDQLRGQLWGELRGQLGDQLGDQLSGQIRDQIRGQLRDQLRDQLRGEFRGQLWGELRDQLSDQLGWQLGGQLGGQLRGSWESYWLTFYQRGGELAGLQYQQQALLDAQLSFAEVCGGWWLPMRGAVSICERPSMLLVDDRGRLHCPVGPALAYRDGYSIWSWHGVRVDRRVVESEPTPEAVDQAANQEVRRVLLERLGLDRYMASAETVATDETGVLLRREVSGEDEPLLAVKVINSTPESDGSRKNYILRVPPDMTSPRAAVAWTFGLEAGEYRPRTET